jgi:hypothetical protein
VITKVKGWRGEVLVEQFAAIRRDHRVEGLSIRAWPTSTGCTGATVRQALNRRSRRHAGPRNRAAREPFKAAIDEMLRSDLGCPEAEAHGEGFWRVWSSATPRVCRVTWCVTVSAAAARRSSPSGQAAEVGVCAANPIRRRPRRSVSALK